LFEGNHGRLRKDFGQFGIFFDGCPMLTNGVDAVSQTGMVCEDKTTKQSEKPVGAGRDF
jgi:hypothetical protein